MRIVYLLAILTAFLPPLSAQTTFIRTYRASPGFFPTADAALQTDQGRIYLGGSQFGNNFLAFGVLFIADENGELIRTREYRNSTLPGAGANSAIGNIFPTADGGLVLGYYFFDQFPYQGGVAKVDADGAPVWGRALQSESATQGFVTALRSGRFALIGNARLSPPNITEHAYALEFDENGTFPPGASTQRTFRQGSALYRIGAAVEDESGNLYLAGQLGNGSLLPIALKINAQTGLVDWVRQYALPNRGVIRSGAFLSDGTLVWGGANGQSLAWLFRTDTLGQVIWSKTYGQTGQDLLINGIAETAPGNLAVSIWNGIAAGIDSAGALTWAYTYNPDNLLFGFSGLSKTPDGGLLFPGVSGPDPENPDRYLLVKTDLEGLAAGCCLRTPVLSAQDRTLSVTNLAITNYDGTPVVLNLNPGASNFPGTTNNTICPLQDPELRDTSICLGGALENILPDAPSGTVFTWNATAGVQFDNAGLMDTTRFSFPEPGPQSIFLEYTLPGDCVTQQIEQDVLVEARPIDLAIQFADSILCPGACTVLEFLGDTTGYSITLIEEGGFTDPLDPDRRCYPDVGEYAILAEITDPDGCPGQSEASILVEEPLSLTPNAFTPNGDGVNDVFRPLIRCEPETYALRIFNRWGQQVYESSDFLAGWDGTVDGEPAPAEVYVWILDTDAMTDAKKGSVTLLR